MSPKHANLLHFIHLYIGRPAFPFLFHDDTILLSVAAPQDRHRGALPSIGCWSRVCMMGFYTGAIVSGTSINHRLHRSSLTFLPSAATHGLHDAPQVRMKENIEISGRILLDKSSYPAGSRGPIMRCRSGRNGPYARRAHWRKAVALNGQPTRLKSEPEAPLPNPDRIDQSRQGARGTSPGCQRLHYH